MQQDFEKKYSGSDSIDTNSEMLVFDMYNSSKSGVLTREELKNFLTDTVDLDQASFFVKSAL